MLETCHIKVTQFIIIAWWLQLPCSGSGSLSTTGMSTPSVDLFRILVWHLSRGSGVPDRGIHISDDCLVPPDLRTAVWSGWWSLLCGDFCLDFLTSLDSRRLPEVLTFSLESLGGLVEFLLSFELITLLVFISCDLATDCLGVESLEAGPTGFSSETCK